MVGLLVAWALSPGGVPPPRCLPTSGTSHQPMWHQPKGPKGPHRGSPKRSHRLVLKLVQKLVQLDAWRGIPKDPHVFSFLHLQPQALGPLGSPLVTWRLGDEERRLMHLVPAPAVKLMKRRVLSRPGINSPWAHLWWGTVNPGLSLVFL